MIFDVLIIGSGPAGWTAAIYTSRANLRTLVLEGSQPGGQLTTTTEIENFPGFAQGITGVALMDACKSQALRFGTTVVSEHVMKVDFMTKPFTVWAENIYQAKTVIIATGAQAKWLQLPSEEQYKGKGVSACATCDGFFFKEKDVLVLGGGDTALEEAIFLTRFAKTVTVVHRRGELRASKILQERAKSHHVQFLYHTQLLEVLGDGVRVTGARLKDTRTQRETQLCCDGIFVAIGHTPNTSVFASSLTLDSEGYVVVSGTQTSVMGVFAAGDVVDTTYKQAITAAGRGCMAALDAERYLTSSY